MTNLDDKFVEKARQAPTRLEHGTTVVLFRGSDVIALVGSAGVIADLDVILDGETAGHITEIELDGEAFGTVKGFHTRIVPDGLSVRVPTNAE